MTDEPERTTETITLITPVLGMTPYTLIELGDASDGSGDPALTVQFGGGADSPLMMPLLVISESPAEGNPVAEMLRTLAAQAHTDDATMEKVTREFNPDWLPFVFPG